MYAYLISRNVKAWSLNIFKHFFIGFLGVLIAYNNIPDVTILRKAFGAGFVAMLISLYNWINPRDTRFGKNYLPQGE